MMTNMALSLQCCVPRIQAGGLERGVGGGVRDGEEKMGARIWKWILKMRKERYYMRRMTAGVDETE